ncbi:phosphatase PAP2 family protein [Niallia taxi]|uniref:acid phosphatase n=1 Tax=Niallia taxi TaxID=2499688 RepID=UPI00203A5CA7|nr:phosphatase PAP2 family protein [Niallia taxi]MCM3216960.1 phosphatase PAP2 family protein [Niallia taxi]
MSNKRVQKKNKKNQKSTIPILLLTTLLTTQGAYTASAAADNSAIEPKPGSYGYYVDVYGSNESSNMTPETNSSIGVLSKFLDIWQPGDSWDNGKVLNESVHNHNINTSIAITKNRTEAEAKDAYLSDRRNQNYSVITGLGPYADNFKTGANAGTTIPDEIPQDATSVKYEDGGNSNGNWAETNSSLGNMVNLINTIRWTGASTSSAKAYYSYKRPFRWSEDVSILPTLVPAKKDDPSSDGGFPSGHTNAAYLASYGLAYAVPERFEEMMTRASELGNSRIVAGMHSPLDVIGGRVMATAVAAAALNDPANKAVKDAAYKEAHEVLLTQEGTSYDAYSDYETNKQNYTKRLTYGFQQIGDTTKPMVVPKGAEVLLETRFPYLDDMQRRWVLYTTGLPSGYPVLDDAEGWGRLNLFAAAGGYEDFETDVNVTMDSSLGGFNAADSWKNDIAGSGKLTKAGTGVLTLTGDNTYTGGTVIEEGSLIASSSTAFGSGDVINNGGTVNENVSSSLTIEQDFIQTDAGTLELQIGSKEEVLNIDGEATFGGTLKLDFTDGYVPAEDANVISYSSLANDSKFAEVEITGLPENYQVAYADNAVRIVPADQEETDNNNPENPSNPDEPVDNEEENNTDNPTPVNPDDHTNEETANNENTNQANNNAGKDTNEDNTAETGSKSENVSTGSKTVDTDSVKNPHTGDDTNIFLYVGTLLASAAAAAIVFWKRKLKKADQ